LRLTERGAERSHCGVHVQDRVAKKKRKYIISLKCERDRERDRERKTERPGISITIT